MERFVDVAPPYRLWVEEVGGRSAPPLLLIMGANAGAMGWPDPLVDLLARRHRVIRYDHRDTGRSTWAFDTHPYAVRDLAEDAVAILDALEVDRAHVVGMSMGGTLLQLLLLDHPERLHSATVFATSALGAGLADPDGRASGLPGPDPRLLALWREMAAERNYEAEIAWRIEHWRILNGNVLPFDPGEVRALEERAIAHAGTFRNPAAHAAADQSGLNRAEELATIDVPTLVIEAPEDPINPPPHAEHLAATIRGARREVLPGMGHALPRTVLEPLAAMITAHTAAVDGPE